VRVKGCPYKERCDYLALFAVGSLIGKVVEVDIEFTRERSIMHMLVDVTRLEFIPKFKNLARFLLYRLYLLMSFL
jgi:hypothetical protein